MRVWKLGRLLTCLAALSVLTHAQILVRQNCTCLCVSACSLLFCGLTILPVLPVASLFLCVAVLLCTPSRTNRILVLPAMWLAVRCLERKCGMSSPVLGGDLASQLSFFCPSPCGALPSPRLRAENGAETRRAQFGSSWCPLQPSAWLVAAGAALPGELQGAQRSDGGLHLQRRCQGQHERRQGALCALQRLWQVRDKHTIGCNINRYGRQNRAFGPYLAALHKILI
jgi:hypothetical protein